MSIPERAARIQALKVETCKSRGPGTNHELRWHGVLQPIEDKKLYGQLRLRTQSEPRVNPEDEIDPLPLYTINVEPHNPNQEPRNPNQEPRSPNQGQISPPPSYIQANDPPPPERASSAPDASPPSAR
ncbi:hypothetical protein BGZ73_004313 [Actinomortierella ambigua]|nr:hypothetical protein BGZ73_004313 [Actinomortierella ambigua]